MTKKINDEMKKELNREIRAFNKTITSSTTNKEIWNKKDSNQNDASAINEEMVKDAIISDNLNKAPFIFVAILVLSFLISFARKRKK